VFEKNFKSFLLLISVPLVTTVFGVGGGIESGRYWFSQPENAYPTLLKSINTEKWFVDGGQVRYQGFDATNWVLGLGVLSTYRLFILAGVIDDIFITSVLLRPELFLVAIHSLLVGSLALAQFGGGWLIYQKSRSLQYTFLFQLSPLYTPLLLLNLTQVNPVLMTTALQLIIFSVLIWFVLNRQKWPKWFLRLKLTSHQVDISDTTFLKMILILSGGLVGWKLLQLSYLLPAILILFLVTLRHLWPQAKLIKIAKAIAMIGITIGATISLIIGSQTLSDRNQEWQTFLTQPPTTKPAFFSRDNDLVEELSPDEFSPQLRALLMGNAATYYQKSDVLSALYGK